MARLKSLDNARKVKGDFFMYDWLSGCTMCMVQPMLFLFPCACTLLVYGQKKYRLYSEDLKERKIVVTKEI